MIDKSKLLERIDKKGGIVSFACRMCIPVSRIKRQIDNDLDFNFIEIMRAKEVLEIADEDMQAVFFTKVSP